MRAITIYDLDRTLIARPTFTRFLHFAALRLAPWRVAFSPVWLVLMIGYRLGLYSRTSLKRMGMRLMLGRPDASSLSQVADRFARAQVFHPGVARVLEQDRAEGRDRVIATAAFGLYAIPIAARLAIDSVIATHWDGADIPGGNCYGANKLARVQAWLAESGAHRANVHVRALSDSFADAPLLDWADEALFVTTSELQARRARLRGWTPIDLTG